MNRGMDLCHRVFEHLSPLKHEWIHALRQTVTDGDSSFTIFFLDTLSRVRSIKQLSPTVTASPQTERDRRSAVQNRGSCPESAPCGRKYRDSCVVRATWAKVTERTALPVDGRG